MKKPHLTVRIWTLAAILVLISVSAKGQDYQKAKDLLRGVTNKDTYLYQVANINSKKIIQLPKNSAVLIYGKLGSFLDVRYQNLKGWGLASSFTIQGTATAPTEPMRVESAIRPAETETSSKEREPSTLPIRLNPYISYVLKGKSFYKQVRGGFEATYEIQDHLSLGVVSDFVFFKGTYLDMGPILRNQWINDSSFFNPSVYVGFLYYSFKRDADKDDGFGFQWAFENEIPILQDKSFQPSISMKVGADLMFFYFDEVRIPFWFSAGMTFRF